MLGRSLRDVVLRHAWRGGDASAYRAFGTAGYRVRRVWRCGRRRHRTGGGVVQVLGHDRSVTPEAEPDGGRVSVAHQRACAGGHVNSAASRVYHLRLVPVRASVRWVLTLTPMSASILALTCSVLLKRRVNEETPACRRHQPQAHPPERS